MTRSDAFNRIRVVLNELAAARFSVARTARESELEPTVLALTDPTLCPSDLKICARNLDITYTLRMFSEFEAVLRDYWSAIQPCPRARRMRMQLLMNRVAARQYIATKVLDDAHDVREHRNDVVHDRLRVPRLTFHDCKSRLARFTGYLPLQW